MKRTTIGLLLAALAVGPGCRKPPAAPAPSGSTIVLKVFVLRDLDDDGEPPQNRKGYAYSDNHIRGLVNDMIERSYYMAGTEVNFSWPGQVVNEQLYDFASSGHFWHYYTYWVGTFLIGLPGYDPNAINIIFLPGILDASNNKDYMDSFAIDPAGNNDPYWGEPDEEPFWKPMILISDCRVWGGVTEPVEHMVPFRDPPEPDDGMVAEEYHYSHAVMFHALGRYLLRHTGDGSIWDGQENRKSGSLNYMRRWTWRADEENNHIVRIVSQGEIRTRIITGQWNNP